MTLAPSVNVDLLTYLLTYYAVNYQMMVVEGLSLDFCTKIGRKRARTDCTPASVDVSV